MESRLAGKRWGMVAVLGAWLGLCACRERTPPAPDAGTGPAREPAALAIDGGLGLRPAGRPGLERIAGLGKAGDVFQVPIEGSPVFGAAGAKVTAVLFADLSDPASAELFTLLEGLRVERPVDLRWVFKHDPSVAPGATGLDAALVAVLATERGRLDAFAAGLFLRPGPIPKERLLAAAQAAGLEPKAVAAALESAAFRQQIDADRRLAARLAVRRAPGLFLNGRRFVTEAQTDLPAGLRAGIDAQVRQSDALLAQGIQPEALYARLTRQGRRSAWTLMTRPERPQRYQAPQAARLEQTELVEPGPGPWLGPDQAPILVVMFADLTCSFCQQMLPALQSLQAAFPQRLRVALRLLPDRRSRAEWLDAAVLLQSLASDPQFWSAAPLLIGQPVAADRDGLVARVAGPIPDSARLRRVLAEPEPWLAQLRENRQAADLLEVRALPTLFVNGRRISGATGQATLERMVDEEIERLGQR